LTAARWWRTGLVALGLVLALVALVVVEVTVHRLSPFERQLLASAPASATAAGCTEVQVVRPYPGGDDRAHIGSGASLQVAPPLSSYPSIPPASGPHDPTPLDAGVYADPPPITRAIHSMEHAAVIVWYDPAIESSSDVARITSFFRQGKERNHVIVAPFRYPTQGAAGTLPADRQMALVAWHHIQYCDRVTLPVAFAFVHSYRFNLYQRGAYRGDAPEKYAPI
jgi:Protein of unknown function (DUF3105)